MTDRHDHDREFLNEHPDIVKELEELAKKSEARPVPVDADKDDARSPEYSDDSLALRFTEQYPDLQFTAAWNRWSIWDGARWCRDDTRKIFNLARLVCRDAASECENERNSPRIASAVTVAAVEKLASSDRRHAATVGQWDKDQWLLNTPGGAVDLRTGILRPSAREDFCTKVTAVAPGGECPMWRAFLERITDGNAELQSFLQRMAGYCLTGSTKEHALFFFYGVGANGKSVFINALSGVMGDYAMNAPVESFTVSKNDSHPTDRAMLQGARLVTAVEVENDRRWAESKLKQITGGDNVTARFMRQDFFQYTPTCKLVIAGNNKPGLSTVDEAIKRRFNLVPFTVTIPLEERDQDLGEKLKAEWPGILQWAILGCAAWQQKGLAPPDIVRAATTEYLDAEDLLGRWLDERCVVARNIAFSSTASLYGSYTQWTESAGEKTQSQKTFSQALEQRGFVRDRKETSRGFVGLGLKTDAAAPERT